MKLAQIFAGGALALGLAAAPVPAQAIGCISGAIAGGIAGHYAGHHGVSGAIGGCIAGHHIAKVKRQKRAEERYRRQHPYQQPAQSY